MKTIKIVMLLVLLPLCIINAKMLSKPTYSELTNSITGEKLYCFYSYNIKTQLTEVCTYKDTILVDERDLTVYAHRLLLTKEKYTYKNQKLILRQKYEVKSKVSVTNGDIYVSSKFILTFEEKFDYDDFLKN